MWDYEQSYAIGSNNCNTNPRKHLSKVIYKEIKSRKTAKVVDKHKWREDEKDEFMGWLDGDSSELYLLGTKLMIHDNEMDKVEKILKLVTERAGTNMK